MIFKFLCLQKPLLKSKKCRTYYAGRGIRSGTPRWGYPSHRYRGGPHSVTKPRTATPLRRPLPASHVWTMNYFLDWPRQYGIDQNKKCRMILRQITMSLDKRNRDCKTSHHGIAELFTSSGQGLLIFDPLDNRNPSLLINYQKVSWLKENQEVATKWGFAGAPGSMPACNMLADNML